MYCILGGFGAYLTREAGVMRATDIKRHRRVVIKLTLSDLVTKETEIYKRLGYGPGLPLIYGRRINATSGYGYFCMEEFAQDLAELVCTHGPVSLWFACRVAEAIVGRSLLPRAGPSSFVLQLRVLSRAHSKAIIHRDIKPHNVVCSSLNGLKLEKLAVIDWGLAADVSEGTDSATRFAGTPAFMSISCLHGNGKPAMT